MFFFLIFTNQNPFLRVFQPQKMADFIIFDNFVKWDPF